MFYRGKTTIAYVAKWYFDCEIARNLCRTTLNKCLRVFFDAEHNDISLKSIQIKTNELEAKNQNFLFNFTIY